METLTKMTTEEINIANAILDANDVLIKMMQQGISEPKFYFAAANMLSQKYNLTLDQSIIILNKALELI
jgi:hypothetical protein